MGVPAYVIDAPGGGKIPLSAKVRRGGGAQELTG
ncbi:hypothetical protein L9S41_01620 [Geoalkalibacter halelectricus]|uniref:Uncharacterized protein n=1 Tax=Geoalkalibacter halelectricus TaxID=2847045 RepID=A0ABY5ZUB6_9BACT|nr:hypothetical protein [Geoalkalibacter halelectricus]MDO3378580.1 hypothetical protein [Geoalkalibacter halelectricus]UWZ81547.1 hypothetical protein L9S41_01620 [Geoalkalibacter halelectricus]